MYINALPRPKVNKDIDWKFTKQYLMHCVRPKVGVNYCITWECRRTAMMIVASEYVCIKCGFVLHAEFDCLDVLQFVYLLPVCCEIHDHLFVSRKQHLARFWERNKFFVAMQGGSVSTPRQGFHPGTCIPVEFYSGCSTEHRQGLFGLVVTHYAQQLFA